MILQGLGSGPPAPSSGAARDIVNWVRPHIVLVTRHSMTLTPLMRVLMALGYYATGSYCLMFGVPAWGIKGCHDLLGSAPCIKGVVCYGIIGKRPCVLFPTSDAKGVSTMLLSHLK